MNTNKNVNSCRKLTSARIAAMLFALLFAVILTLSSCTGGEGGGGGIGGLLGGNGQEPVYTGMTIGDTPTTSAGMLPERTLLSLGMPGALRDNVDYGDTTETGSATEAVTNGQGSVSGDLPGNQADQNDPFDQLPDQEVEAGSDNSDILLEDAKDSLQVEGSAKPIYYAQKNQDIYITVHINNPDSFEILSFTLNGNKYSSYMFEPGSDMENLILKVNVGDVEGVQDYTIDAIKYVDGTDIKDVRMDGDKTVRAGVWSEKQPVPIVKNENIGFNDISFEITMDDTLSLIEKSEGTVMAVIYDGEQVRDMQPITLGQQNAITFSGLTTNALYQYAIIAYYDALDGTGSNVYVLETKAFYTRAILLFDNVTLGTETVDYQLVWADDAPDKTVTSLMLEHETEGKVELDTNTTSISGLLSDNAYTLTATYMNGANTESVSINFTTVAKKTPSATLTETSVSQTELGFALQIDDPDSVATLTHIELISDKTGTAELALDATGAGGLLSDTAYTVRATYVYDLNDGSGVHEAVVELKIRTLAKAAPYLTLSSGNVGQEEFAFDVTIHDPDGVAVLTRLDLINSKTGTTELPLDSRVAAGLLSNTGYTLRATYTYDLGDGAGVHEAYTDIKVTTLAKTIPSLTLTPGDVGQIDFTFDLLLTDPDGIAALTRITLLCTRTGETVELPLDSRNAGSLLTDTAYVLEAHYVYDLNDGTGTHAASTKLEINTEPKTVPTVTLTAESVDKESFSFALSVADPDSIATLLRFELLSDKTDPAEISLDARTLDALLSDTTYTLRAWFSYDLGDGTGTHEAYTDLTVTTLAKTVPTYSVTEYDKEHDYITVNTFENDPDNVGQIVDLSIYLDGEWIASSETFDAATFYELISNKNYRAVLTYQYDLNDGNGVITEEVDVHVLTKVYFVPVGVTNTTNGDVSEGEYIYIDINVINPGGAVVEAVRINGLEYKASAATTTNDVVRVEIKYEYQFAGGWNDFVVESLTASANGETHVYPLTENNVATVFINGKLEVEDFAITDAAGIPVAYAFPSDPVAFYIALFDQTGYRIDSVTVRCYYDRYDWNYSEITYGAEQIIALGNGAIMIPLINRSGGIHDYSIVNVQYSNPASDFTNSIEVSTTRQSLTCFDTDEIIYVSKPEDLKNMNRWAYYQLVNDIDLSGEALGWINPGNFYGYFDGNGYSIKNMSVRRSFDNENLSIGLFHWASGKIFNLNLTDVLITSTVSNTLGNNDWYQIRYGAIATEIDNRLILDNVHVDQLVDIKTSGNVSDNVGVLFPYGCEDRFYVTETVTVSGKITVNESNNYNESLGQSASALPQPPAFDADSNPADFRITVNYVTGYNATLAPVQTILIGQMPQLSRPGYLFCGWYDNSAFTGTPVQPGIRPDGSITLYAKWIYIGINESTGLEIVNGVVMGIGTCTDSVLYINRPISYDAFNNCNQITAVYLGSDAVIFGAPFTNCSNLRMIIVSGAIKNAESIDFWNWGVENVRIITDKAPDESTQNTDWIYHFELLTTKDGVTYACKDDGTAIVLSFDDTVAHLVIGVDGYEVTEIAPRAFYGCKTLESIVLPDSLVKIGEYAFYNCVNMGDLVLPDALTYIGNHAFYNCDKMTAIVIPGNVTHIGVYAFQDCTALVSITVSEGVTVIDEHAFAGCYYLVQVSLPSTLTEIGNYAFASCHYGLTSIIIPEGVTKIGTWAFEYCYSLSSISLPSTLTEIGAYAFQSVGINFIAIPQSVTTIGEYAFNNGTIYLAAAKVPATWHQNWNGTDREDYVVYNFKEFYTDAQGVTYALFRDKTAIVIAYEGEGVSIDLSVQGYTLTEIANSVFQNCNWIESVTLPATIVKIGDNAFNNCRNLTSITLPEGLEHIGQSAFEHCICLQELILPKSLTHIGGMAFYSCDSLTTLTIPGTVSYIGDSAFNECNSLETLVISEGITTIGDNVFANCYALHSVSLPSTLTEIGVRSFASCNNLPSVVIPEGVTRIGDYAFAYNYALNSISLPSTLTEIGAYAFQDAYVQHLEIPASVTTIGEYAFQHGTVYVHSASKPSGWNNNWNGENRSDYVVYNFERFYTDAQGVCYALFNDKTATAIGYQGESTDIVIGVDGYTVTKIGSHAFASNYAIESVVIPEGVTTICEYAFADCINLLSIKLPSSLTNLEYRAFSNISGNAAIRIPSTLTEIASHAFSNAKLFCELQQAPDGWASNWYGDHSERVTWNVADTVTDEYGVTYVKLNDGTVYIASVSGEVSEIVLGGNSAFPVTEIPAYLLDYRNDITTITIHSDITTIGEYAFHGSNIHIYVPITVTEVGDAAFSDCFVYAAASTASAKWAEGWNSYQYLKVLWNAPNGTFCLGSDGLTYLLVNGTAHLYLYRTNNSELTINGLDGYPTVVHSITSNGSYQEGSWDVQTLIIGENVTKLDDYAFFRWHNLKNVTLPDSLIEIGQYAFSDCGSLTKLTLPETIQKISAYAFSGVPFDMITVPSSISYVGEGAFSTGTILMPSKQKPNNWHQNWYSGNPSNVFWNFKEFYTDDNGITYVLTNSNVAYVYTYERGASELIIGDIDGYEVVVRAAFEYDQYLEKVTLLDTVTRIEAGAFQGCENLREVNMPESLTYIGEHAFNSTGCHIFLPTSVTNIGAYAFSGCCVYVTGAEALPGWDANWIGSGAAVFSAPEGTLFTAEDGTTYLLCADNIAHLYFYNVHNSELVINGLDGYKVVVHAINPDDYNWAVQKLIIGEGVVKLDDYTFQNYQNLTEVSLPDSLTEIGAYAFYNTGLSSRMVIIPKSVTTIGKYAFYGCTVVTPHAQKPDGWSENWYSGSTSSIYWDYKELLTDANGITYVGTNHGIAYTYSYNPGLTTVTIGDVIGYKVVVRPTFRNSSITSVTLLNTVIKVEEYAFYCCYSLKTVTMPDASLTEIGAYAFYDAPLNKPTIPRSVQSIGENAFSCDSIYPMIGAKPAGWHDNWFSGSFDQIFWDLLEMFTDQATGVTYIIHYDGTASIYKYEGTATDIVIGSTVNGHTVVDIYSGAFADTQITSIVLPDSITYIGDNAFMNCYYLAQITLPADLTQIGNYAFYGCSELTAITLPNKTQSIGSYAFAECFSLETIDLPASLTEIGTYAFYRCTWLTGITVPAGVSEIGAYAFSDCTSLETAVLSKGITVIGDYAFSNCNALTAITIPSGVTSIGVNAFNNCNSLKSVTLAEGLISIGEGAFQNCDKLESILLPSTLQEIDSYAFYSCDALTAINIPGSVSTIGDHAFMDCYNLKTVTIEDGVSVIGDYAFYNCDDLVSVEIPEGVTTIGQYAFHCCWSLKNVTLPSTLTEIGSHAFNGVSTQRIIIPKSVTYVGDYAFSNGTIYLQTAKVPGSWSQYWNGDGRKDYVVFNLDKIFTDDQGVTYILFNNGTAVVFEYTGEAAEITIGVDGYTVTEITARAFYENQYLEKIVLRNGLLKIGEYAFYNCRALTEVILPESLITIDSYAFSHCSALTEVILPESLITINSNAFGNCSALTSIVVPSGVQSLEDGAFRNCSALTSVVIASDQITVLKESTFNHCNNLVEITLPDSLTEIGNYAFYNCHNLKSVNLPTGLTKIGEHAFYNCDQADIKLPMGLIEIGAYAFNQTEFKHIEIPASVTVIGEYAFNYGTVYVQAASKPTGWNKNWNGEYRSDYVVWGIEKLYTDAQGVTYVLFADQTATIIGYTGEAANLVFNVDGYAITKIGAGAFQGNYSIESVVIPETVTVIGENAFRDCRELRSVTLSSALTTIENYAFYNISSFVTIYVSSDISYIGEYAFNCGSLFCNAQQAPAEWAESWHGYDNRVTWDVAAFVTDEYGVTYVRLNDGTTYIAGVNGHSDEIVLGGNPDFPVTEIPERLFENRAEFSKVTIDPSIQKIGAYAFHNSGITAIVLPEGLQTIGENAFYNCYNLSVVTLPDSLQTIEQYAFYGCNAHVRIPAQVKVIGAYAFQNCYAYVTVAEKPADWSFDWNGYYNYSNVAWNVPAGIFCQAEDGTVYLLDENDIAHLYFYDKNLLELTVSAYKNYDTVVHGVQEGNGNVHKLIVGEGIVKLDTYAFYNWYNLQEITLPSTLTEIGAYAFSAINLGVFTVPTNVTIGESAFSQGVMLVTLTEKPENWHDNWYSGSQSNVCWAFKEFYTDEQTGITYLLTSTDLAYVYDYDRDLTELVIGGIEGYEVIVRNVFNNNQNIVKVTLLEGVISIEAEAFYNCSNLAQVVLPNTLKKIGENAFCGCSALTTLMLPESVTTIDYGAFQNTYAHIYLPASVTTIGSYAFNSCYVYAAIEAKPEGWNYEWNNYSNEKVAWNVPSGWFITTEDGNTYLLCDDGTAHLYFYNKEVAELTINGAPGYNTVIHGTDMSSNNWVEKLTIGEGVTKLADHAFYYWHNLTEVSLPSSLVEISSHAFYNCDNLASINIPEGVRIIGEHAFYDCNALTEVLFPTTLDEIGTYAFYNVPLNAPKIPKNVNKIGANAFSCSEIYPMTSSKPEGWDVLWYNGMYTNVFWDMLEMFYDQTTGITYIIHTNGTASIYTFDGSVSDIVIDTVKGCIVTNMYPNVFANSAITSIVLPDTLTYIPEYAFYQCYNLTSVVFPNALTSIGDYAFQYCQNLQSVTLPSTLKEIGASAFYHCNSSYFTAITFPAGLTTIGDSAFQYCYALQSINLPDSVTTIGDDAFYQCHNAQMSKLPSSLISIGEHAFNGVRFTDTLIIPESVTTIGYNALHGSVIVFHASKPEGWHENWHNGDDSEITWNVKDIYVDTAYGVTYLLFNDNTASVIDFDNRHTTVEILSEINGCTVTKIAARAFYGSEEIEIITLPDSLMYIGKEAFYNCLYLKQINLPEGLKEIGANAFRNCDKLTSITIPESITKIGDGVFYDCSELQSVTLPNSLTEISNNAFSNCVKLSAITIPTNVTVIGEGAFYNCCALTSIVIPESVTEIGAYAFQYCSALTSIVIPESVTTIGEWAFYNSGLTSVVIPDSVTKIERYAFSCCYSLQSVTLSNGLTEIAEYTFSSCHNLTEIIIPNSVTKIGAGAFESAGLQIVVIPESVTTICSYAFSTGYLQSAVIPSSVTTVEDYAFTNGTIYVCHAQRPENWADNWNSTGRKEFVVWNFDKFHTDEQGVVYALTKNDTALVIDYQGTAAELDLTLDGYTVTAINADAFRDCDTLVSVIIPEGVTEIGNYAFYDCNGLTTVVIPEGVTEIGNYAFRYCYNLTSVYIPGSVTAIGNYAFYNCNKLYSVVIPASVTTIEYGAFSSCDNTIIGVVASERPAGWDSSWGGNSDKVVWNCAGIYTDAQGVVYALLNDQTAIVLSYAGTATEIDLTLDGYTVTAINAEAFRNCDTLVSIVIPESVTEIGAYAFYDCDKLTSVVIPESVTEIGAYAFQYCSALTSIVIPEGVTTIGEWTFYKSGLTSIVIPDSVTMIERYAFSDCYSLQSVTLPNGLTEIAEYTFSICFNLREIVIPDSVTEIGENAFYECNNLTSVVIPEGVTTIGEYAFYYCHNLTAVYIPESVTTIGSDAFVNCWNATFYVTASEQPAGWDSNWCDNSVQIIWNCKDIYTDGQGVVYALLNDQTAIVLDYEGTATEIYLPLLIDGYTVTAINKEAFRNCDTLVSVIIPESVTIIDNYAFCDCNGLTTVVIPESVITIGDYAFSYCYSLIQIIIPQSVTTMGDSAFVNCGNTTFYVTASEQPAGWSSNWVDGFDRIIWNFKELYTDEQGVVYALLNDNTAVVVGYEGTATEIDVSLDLEDYTLTAIGNRAFSGCYGLTSVVIPEGVTIIGNDAFYYCYGLTEIVIPDSVTSIGAQAFYNCYKLTSVVLPEGIKTISDYAFYNCYHLTEIVIPDSVTEIGEYAFYDCDGLTTVVIPESITAIGDYAFYNCYSMTSIIIPESVTTIGEYAFCYCDNLTAVYIPESVTTIGYAAFVECPNATFYVAASEQPAGWDSYWTNYTHKVVWGYTA